MEDSLFGKCPCGCNAGNNGYGLCDDCNEMLCLEMEDSWFGKCPCGCDASDSNEMLCLKDEEI